MRSPVSPVMRLVFEYGRGSGLEAARGQAEKPPPALPASQQCVGSGHDRELGRCSQQDSCGSRVTSSTISSRPPTIGGCGTCTSDSRPAARSGRPPRETTAPIHPASPRPPTAPRQHRCWHRSSRPAIADFGPAIAPSASPRRAARRAGRCRTRRRDVRSSSTVSRWRTAAFAGPSTRWMARATWRLRGLWPRPRAAAVREHQQSGVRARAGRDRRRSGVVRRPGWVTSLERAGGHDGRSGDTPASSCAISPTSDVGSKC